MEGESRAHPQECAEKRDTLLLLWLLLLLFLVLVLGSCSCSSGYCYCYCCFPCCSFLLLPLLQCPLFISLAATVSVGPWGLNIQCCPRIWSCGRFCHVLSAFILDTDCAWLYGSYPFIPMCTATLRDSPEFNNWNRPNMTNQNIQKDHKSWLLLNWPQEWASEDIKGRFRVFCEELDQARGFAFDQRGIGLVMGEVQPQHSIYMYIYIYMYMYM